MNDSPALSTGSRKAAVAFIFVTVLLDMLALGMIIPVLPELVKMFRGGDTVAAAETFGWFNTVGALMQFVASPVAGALSDRLGRRPIVLVSNFGLGIDYFVMAVAPSLGWLFVGRIVSGIASASVPTAFAYISDVTPADKRAKAFGLMGAAFGAGFVLGPAIGGVLGQFGPRLPFLVAGGFSVLNAMYGLFVLPESLPPDRRRAFDWRRANPFGALRYLATHPQLRWFASMDFLYKMAHAALPSVFVLYAGYRYHWDSQHVGYTLAAVGITSAIVQGALVGPVVGAIGERRALILGLVGGAIGFSIYGFAETGLMFVIGVPVMGLWSFYGPSAQSLMARQAGPQEHGQLQGALASLAGIANVISPYLFSSVFAAAIGRYARWGIPGAPFLLSGALLLSGLMFGLRASSPSRLAAPARAPAS